MAYALEYDTKQVLPYLRHYEGLSREGRLVLFATLREYLGEHGDDFRRNEGFRRWGTESSCFEFQLVLGDPDNPGSLRVFRFVINDEAASYGVLRIVYVDDQSVPP